MIAKLVVLISILCCAYIIIVLGLHSLQLCNENVWLIPVFIIGSFSVPFLNYFARCLPVYLRMFRLKIFGRKTSKMDLMKEHVYSSVVLPSDLDIFIHMNNSRYQRELDFARVDWYFKTGLLEYFERTGYWLITAAATRYRRSLEALQRFNVKTKIIYWDEQHVYFQHKFTTKEKNGGEFVNAIIVGKYRIPKGQTPEKTFCEVTGSDIPPERPQLSPELEYFMNYIETSSDNLRKEAGLEKSN